MQKILKTQHYSEVTKIMATKISKESKTNKRPHCTTEVENELKLWQMRISRSRPRSQISLSPSLLRCYPYLSFSPSPPGHSLSIPNGSLSTGREGGKGDVRVYCSIFSILEIRMFLL